MSSLTINTNKSSRLQYTT